MIVVIVNLSRLNYVVVESDSGLVGLLLGGEPPGETD